MSEYTYSCDTTSRFYIVRCSPYRVVIDSVTKYFNGARLAGDYGLCFQDWLENIGETMTNLLYLSGKLELQVEYPSPYTGHYLDQAIFPEFIKWVGSDKSEPVRALFRYYDQIFEDFIGKAAEALIQISEHKTNPEPEIKPNPGPKRKEEGLGAEKIPIKKRKYPELEKTLKDDEVFMIVYNPAKREGKPIKCKRIREKRSCRYHARAGYTDIICHILCPDSHALWDNIVNRLPADLGRINREVITSKNFPALVKFIESELV